MSYKVSKLITNMYSTSFSMGTYLLGSSVRPKIYSIYGFVRCADEIVDTFYEEDPNYLLDKFIEDYHDALERKISLNPVLNSFQEIVNQYGIEEEVDQFIESMKMDLSKQLYETDEEYEKYILGSAEVVGHMCLKVFVDGNDEEFNKLKPYASKLGSAFQKVNFLRDLKSDYQNLGRMYFPNLSFSSFSESEKEAILAEIQAEFDEALIGIKQLPFNSRLGVYVAYKY